MNIAAVHSSANSTVGWWLKVSAPLLSKMTLGTQNKFGNSVFFSEEEQ